MPLAATSRSSQTAHQRRDNHLHSRCKHSLYSIRLRDYTNAAVYANMSTPQAKRRRLNEAAKTLNKPFKSPFRTPLRPGIGSDPPSSDPPEVNAPLATPASDLRYHSSTDGAQSAALPKQPPSTSVSSQPRSYRPLPSRPSFSTASRAPSKKAPTKPALTREIMQLRNEMQILSQAHTLATSSKDDDLVVLIEKWRTVSRTVAEELFATTRDKVNRMGGVGAWKAREREGKERQQQWDKEEREAEREKMEKARENGEMGDEAYDKYAEMTEDNGEGKEEETFKAADDDVSRSYATSLLDTNMPQSFTMDMMLKTLNIDLELIGYNKEAQRWDG
jgi:Swi5-dependent recombination DNA repair protein 1